MADDKHMLAGNNYRCNHHFLGVMFEALWLSVVEIYLGQRESSGDGLEAGEMTDKVIPWLRGVSEEHEILRAWTTFMLVDWRILPFSSESELQTSSCGKRGSGNFLLFSQALAKTDTKGWPSTT